jgi:hypothetical protein
MFNEILNNKIDESFLKFVEKDCSPIPSQYSSMKDRNKKVLFNELKRELKNQVLPSLKDIRNIDSFEWWLDDVLSPGLQFNLKISPYKLEVHPEIYKLSKEPYDFFRQMVGLELYDFCCKNGLSGFKECALCNGYFIGFRSDRKYCTDFCRRKASKINLEK